MVGGARAVARCDTLGVAPYSDTADGLFRAYLTPAHRAAVDRIGAWMVEAGLTVRLDPAANLVGRYEGAEPGAQALVFGSHIDSVRDAGRYDGPLGVMLAIELVVRLGGRRLPFAIEIYAFGDEEGSRFPASMLCSGAVAGMLTLAALDVGDREDIPLGDALRGFNPEVDQGIGEDAILPWPEAIGLSTFVKAKRSPSDILAFIEPHIEQGPVLESENLAVGVVTGIAAQLRFQATLTGAAGHAGTTSMTLRRDALAAAAEMVGTVETQALAARGDVVATVGRLAVAPGAVNVVPGEVTFSIDIRSGDQSRRDATAAAITDVLHAIAARRHVVLALEQVQDLPAFPCDPALMALLDESLVRAGQPPKRLVSGAGHDTMMMAALCPTAMLFLRSPGGISHNPAERVRVEDAEIALDVLGHFVTLFEETYAPAT